MLRRPRTPLLESIDLLCIGAVCTLVGVVVALAAAEVAPSVLVDIGELARPPSLLSWRLVASLVLALGVAVGVALGVGRAAVWHLSRNVEIGPGTTWTATVSGYLDADPADQPGTARSIFAVARLKDGAHVGGQLARLDVKGDTDITLAKPLFVVHPNETARHPLAHDFVVLPGREIALMYGLVVRKGSIPAEKGKR